MRLPNHIYMKTEDGMVDITSTTLKFQTAVARTVNQLGDQGRAQFLSSLASRLSTLVANHGANRDVIERWWNHLSGSADLWQNLE